MVDTLWMPWREVSVVDLRYEFVQFASRDGSNVARLCRQFGISRECGYKWLSRYRAGGEAGLKDISRRPHGSPRRSPERIESRVLALRAEHPCWGGRTLRRVLQNEGM